jgi:hypothetical protein
MSKRRTADTVNRMGIFRKNRNLSVPETKIDSIMVLVRPPREAEPRPLITEISAILGEAGTRPRVQMPFGLRRDEFRK